jgi:hypothetical protein
MSDFEGVNTGVSDPPAGDTGSVSGAADLGGQSGSTGISSGSAGVTSSPAMSESAPASGVPGAIGSEEGGLDAGAGEQVGFSEEEIETVPDEWREKFRSLLGGHKSLEADHRSLKKEYSDTKSLFEGLNGFATDEAGNLVFDPQTNLPIPSTSGFVSKISESSPAIAGQLFRDLWAAPRPDGKTNAQAIFEELGLDPNRLEDYQSITNDPTSRSSATKQGDVSPEELAVIPDRFHDVYKQLSASQRFTVQQMDDDELHEYLDEKRELFDSRQFREEMKQRETAQAESEMKAFWDNVDKTHVEYSNQLRENAFAQIQKSLTDQIQFSSDSTVNAVQTGAVMTILSSILEPSQRSTVSGVLNALGINLDPQFDQTIEALGQHAYLTKRYEAINGNPKLAAYRNEAAYRQSQAEVKRLYDLTLAKVNGVALKVAKALAGGNQEMRDQRSAALNVSARPTIGNGGAPSSGGNQPVTAKPFTVEWLQQRRSLGQ